jgi:hypothetical protein
MNKAENAEENIVRNMNAVDALIPSSFAGNAMEYAGINCIE